MREPAIRARRGDFARLVEMPGGPDAQRFADRPRWPRPTTSVAPRRLREPEHDDAEHEPERDAHSRERFGEPNAATSRASSARRRHAARVRQPAGARRRPAPRRPRCRAGTCGRRVQRRRWWHCAHRGARDGDVRRQPRTVALGPRRSVDADDRRADGGGDVRRPGVAGHHHARRRAPAPRDRQSSSAATASRRRRAPARRPSSRQLSLAGSPQHDGHQAMPLAKRDGHAPPAARRPALVRPRGAGIEQRVAAAGRARASRRATADGDRVDRKLRRAGRDAERLEQPEVDLARRAASRSARSMPLAARIVHVGVEHARERLAQVLAAKPMTRGAPDARAMHADLISPCRSIATS